jgi:ubiquinone/menaquinone biosynthesis C-methylase UbiE
MAEKSYEEWFHNETLLPVLKIFVSKLPNAPTILDLGCGVGGESKRLIELGAHVIGVDFSPKSLDYAKKRIKKGEFINEDIRKINFKKGTFNGILDAGTLFHFSEQQQNQILRKLLNFLKIDGVFLSIFPEGDYVGIQEVNQEKKLLERYVRLISKEQWIKQVTKQGFKKYNIIDFTFGKFICVEFQK